MNRQIQIEGKRIFYRVYGNGKPTMLLHGFGETGEVWNKQVEFLKDDFRLIVPDLPGTGESEMISDMSIDGMSEVIKAIFDAEIEKGHELQRDTVLIGHSMGGYITLAYLTRHRSA